MFAEFAEFAKFAEFAEFAVLAELTVFAGLIVLAVQNGLGTRLVIESSDHRNHDLANHRQALNSTSEWLGRTITPQPAHEPPPCPLPSLPNLPMNHLLAPSPPSPTCP